MAIIVWSTAFIMHLSASAFPAEQMAGKPAACCGASERIEKSFSLQIEDSPPLAEGSFNRSALALNRLQYCNAVQSKIGFVRFPRGTIGVWSTEFGEMADVMTRVPRIYPCADTVVMKGDEEEWRSSVTGDPSRLVITYKFEKPGAATTSEITVAPHVAVFRYTFLERTHKRYLVFDFSRMNVEGWAALNRWTDRKISRLDDRTFQASIGEPGRMMAFYVIQFNVPCLEFGAVDPSGRMGKGRNASEGTSKTMYARFDSTTVTVAVAGSFADLGKAQDYLASEFTDFDTARQRCGRAWEEVLGRVEIDGPENSKRMAYTALYSIYSNIITADEGSCYADWCSHPTSVSSSAFWQFIGGYQSCAFDNSHAAYPFLLLVFPEVMSDVVDTYLARYKRDGIVSGNACLYTGPIGGKFNIRYTPVVAAAACMHGVRTDYSAMYAALKDNFQNTDCVPADLSRLGYLVHAPDDPFPVSRTLELAAASDCMAMLAKAEKDHKEIKNFIHMAQSYKNLWDKENRIFRAKDRSGKWGAINNADWTWNPNPQGLFEGTNLDYSFCVPHDPYGLIGLPGQENFVDRMIDYCGHDAWFNDFSYVYPYLLYYAGAANEAQNILRRSWIPLYKDGVMFENVCAKPPHNGWNGHYTSNAAWLLCSMIGLYPVQSPAGQYIIASPSVSEAAIRRGAKCISIRAKNNNEENIYIQSIKLDGKNYPCYMIPAQRLISGAEIELEMGSDPMSGLGNLYISSTDGFVQDAELLQEGHLECTVAAAVKAATTKIYCHTRPDRVVINGRNVKNARYDEIQKILILQTEDTAKIKVLLK